MNIIDILAAWLAAVLAALASFAGASDPSPAPVVADPEPVVIEVPVEAEIGTPLVVENNASVPEDTLAEDYERIAHLVDEDGNVETPGTDDQVGLQVLYCAPHIAADPTLSVQFGCEGAIVPPEG